jgi:hypothetical protein
LVTNSLPTGSGCNQRGHFSRSRSVHGGKRIFGLGLRRRGAADGPKTLRRSAGAGSKRIFGFHGSNTLRRSAEAVSKRIFGLRKRKRSLRVHLCRAFGDARATHTERKSRHVQRADKSGFLRAPAGKRHGTVSNRRSGAGRRHFPGLGWTTVHRSGAVAIAWPSACELYTSV